MAFADLVDSRFDAAKAQVLSAIAGCDDNSKKGGLDAPILELLNAINATHDYVTTSSCSGRCAVFGEQEHARKRTGVWLLASHEAASAAEIEAALTPDALAQTQGAVLFKFEPFILHVQCRSLAAARAFLTAALDAGMRNSGIVLGKKYMVAVRTTLKLEAPVAMDGRRLVSPEYVQVLANMATTMFRENELRTQRFAELLQKALAARDAAQGAEARRREEKRAAGLARQAAVRAERAAAAETELTDGGAPPSADAAAMPPAPGTVEEVESVVPSAVDEAFPSARRAAPALDPS